MFSYFGCFVFMVNEMIGAEKIGVTFCFNV